MLLLSLKKLWTNHKALNRFSTKKLIALKGFFYEIGFKSYTFLLWFFIVMPGYALPCHALPVRHDKGQGKAWQSMATHGKATKV